MTLTFTILSLTALVFGATVVAARASQPRAIPVRIKDDRR